MYEPTYTTEERIEFTQRAQTQLAKLLLDLDPYSPDSKCPKCHFGHLTTSFERVYPSFGALFNVSKKSGYYTEAWATAEAMERHCPNCTYSFYERALDSTLRVPEYYI